MIITFRRRSSSGGLLAVFAAGALVLAAPASAADCLAAPSGLASWWPGDGNANDIAGTNHGSLQAGATANTAGLVGSGFRFDGTNSYVAIPDSATLKPTNLTVVCWVRFSLLTTPGNTISTGQEYMV